MQKDLKEQLARRIEPMKKEVAAFEAKYQERFAETKHVGLGNRKMRCIKEATRPIITGHPSCPENCAEHGCGCCGSGNIRSNVVGEGDWALKAERKVAAREYLCNTFHREGMDRRKTKEAALKVLAQMNALIRDKNFAKMVVGKKYEMLAERIRGLGWLALVGDQSVVETPNGKELRARLKLVSPDARDAKRLP